MGLFCFPIEFAFGLSFLDLSERTKLWCKEKMGIWENTGFIGVRKTMEAGYFGC